MHFPFSFNGVATAIQTLTPSYIGGAGNGVRDITMEDALWFNFAPSLNHGQTHVDPTYGGDVTMNEIAETKYEVPDHVEKGVVMGDEPISDSREGLSILSIEYDIGDETEVSMEDEPTSRMREALNAFTIEDPNPAPKNLNPDDITMSDNGSEPDIFQVELRDPLDAERPSKRRRLLYQLTPPRRRSSGRPKRHASPVYMPIYTLRRG